MLREPKAWAAVRFKAHRPMHRIGTESPRSPKGQLPHMDVKMRFCSPSAQNLHWPVLRLGRMTASSERISFPYGSIGVESRMAGSGRRREDSCRHMVDVFQPEAPPSRPSKQHRFNQNTKSTPGKPQDRSLLCNQRRTPALGGGASTLPSSPFAGTFPDAIVLSGSGNNEDR
jgi:hypothetical protein